MPEKNCSACVENKKKNQDSVPFIVYEAEMMRSERKEKRLFIALVVAVIMIFAAAAAVHIGWLWYESQFDYVTEEYSYSYEQDGHGTNIIGNDNEVNNGAKTEN